jgi:hypothetical protein
VSGREIRLNFERAADQLDCARMPPAFMGDQPEQMQRVGMIGGFLQQLSIKSLGPVAPSCPVIGVGRLEIAEGPRPSAGRIVDRLRLPFLKM